MQKFQKFQGLLVALLLATTPIQVLAHGDVTPHPIDTSTLKPLGDEWIEPNPYRGDATAIAVGALGYMHNCAGCHGLNAVSGGIAPDLLLLGKECLDLASKVKQAACMKESDHFFKEVTLRGKKNGEGRSIMPAYDAVFKQEAVWAVKAYIDSRSLEEKAKNPN